MTQKFEERVGSIGELMDLPAKSKPVSSNPSVRKKSTVRLAFWDFTAKLLTGLFVTATGTGLLYTGYASFISTARGWSVPVSFINTFWWVIGLIYLAVSASEFKLAPNRLNFQSIENYARTNPELFCLWVLIVLIDIYGCFSVGAGFLTGKSVFGYMFTGDWITVIFGLVIAFVIAFGSEPVIKSGVKFLISTVKEGV